MKIVSDEYKVIAESLDGDARYIERITLDDGTVLTDKIEELKYSNMCNNSTNFSFGNTASAILEFQINMPTVELQDKEIVVEQGLELADGTIEYIKLGKFKVDSIETEAFRASYRCVDAMTYKMSTKYESQLTYPTTDLDVLEEVCAQAGISLVNSDLTSHTVSKKLENYTKREIMGIIAQLQGKNAVINADGNLELLWYESADYVIDDSRIYSDRTDIIKSEINYSLDYIVSNYGSTSIKVGDGDTGATISNPYMTQEILDEVFAKIGGFTFTTAEVDFYGDFRLEVGDIVSLQTDGVTYVLPVMTLEHNSDGGVVTTVGSVGETATQNSVDTNGKTLNELKRSVVNSEKARSIAEQAADKISFVVEGDTASEFTITDNVIQATTEKLVIKTDKGGEVVIQNGIMYVDDIFAEEITATGTITGAKLYGTHIESKTGEIGGFTISNNALYNGTDSIGSTEDGVYLGTNGLKTVGVDGYVTHDAGQSTYKFFFTKDKSTDTPDSVIEIDGQGVILDQYTIDGEQVSDVHISFSKEGVPCGYITTEGIVAVRGETAENAILSFKGNANLKSLDVTGNTTLAGATSSGNIKITTDSATQVEYELKNSARRGRLINNANGRLGLYDSTNGKWLFYSDTDGALNIPPITTFEDKVTIKSLKKDTDTHVVCADSKGKLGVSSITSTELYGLLGVTSNIQDQLDAITEALAINYINSGNVSASMVTGTSANITSIELPAAGTYLLVGGVRYTPGSGATLSTTELCINTSTNFNTNPTNYVKQQDNNLASETAALSTVTIATVSAKTTYYLNGRVKTSGSSAATALGRLFAIKIPKM